jgi:hypothetical protein
VARAPTTFYVGDDALAMVVPMFGAIVGDWDYLGERDA